MSAGPPAGPITFRTLTPADFALLASWLAEPHVHRWWHHEVDAASVERDFGPSARGEDVHRLDRPPGR